MYFADANGRSVDVFNNSGVLLRAWNTINGSSGYEGIHVAVDNSTATRGEGVYLSLASPEDYVEVIDPLNGRSTSRRRQNTPKAAN